MAEVEYEGIKVSGGKLLFILPLLGTLGGALWGGFEFYKDYMDMKEQIQNYVAPDLSGFQEQLSVHNETINKTKDVLELEFANLKEVDSAMNDTIRAQVDGMKDKISDIKEELRGVEDDLMEETKLVEDFIKDTAAEIEKESTALMDSLDRQEERNRNNVDTVRGIINAFEIRMDSKIDKLNDKLDNLEDNFDAKIKKALDNPLNN